MGLILLGMPLWQVSARIFPWSHYVGEWHSHPESDPTPSSLDLSEWRKVCTATDEAMAFLILGTAALWFGINAGGELRRAAQIL